MAPPGWPRQLRAWHCCPIDGSCLRIGYPTGPFKNTTSGLLASWTPMSTKSGA